MRQLKLKHTEQTSGVLVLQRTTAPDATHSSSQSLAPDPRNLLKCSAPGSNPGRRISAEMDFR
jgi:hypothetical protein